MTTFTYDNPNGKGTNTVTYAQNKDGAWTVVSNYYYNCSGSSYGSSSTGSDSGACGDYSSSSTKSGTGGATSGDNPGGDDDNSALIDNNSTQSENEYEHFTGKDVAFDGTQAGKKGYILYDWEGDGVYDHIEYGSISDDGLSYSYYSNNGFDGTDENGNPQENYYTRYFSNDSNAHADNNGNGIVRFIPLN